jgi:secreted PhoX family phosphatase
MNALPHRGAGKPCLAGHSSVTLHADSSRPFTEDHMHHDDDIVANTSKNQHINDLIEQRRADPKRRGLLKGGLGAASLSFLSLGALAGCGGDDDAPASVPAPAPPPPAPPPAPARPTSLSFTAVAKSLADTVTVPAGYTATVLMRLGDPIAAGVAAYGNVGTDDPATFDRRIGDHHDGMHYFGLSASNQYAANNDRGLIAMNHEAITSLFLHPTGQTIAGTSNAAVRTVAAEVLREFYVHGVSITEVNRATNGAWSFKQDSTLNRRIHTLTPMDLSGPVRGNALVVTKYSPTGTQTRGTVNNCANGYTPWYSYLTCEENWAGYFRRITANDNPNRSAKEITALTRYGVAGTGRELWATVTPDTTDNLYGRWNVEVQAGQAAASDYRNVNNTYGWVVEIDPYNPTSTPKKRTALGRFGHEGAWPAKATAGKPLVFYMGDDSRNEYIYKYVSNAVWDPADAARTDRMAVGDKYLDSGKLYVARFNADGTGNWIELSITNPTIASYATYAFADQADVLTNCRLAADAVGATKMDRPEWGAVDFVTGEVYMTLTNNNATNRTLASTDGANPRHYNDPRGAGATAQFGNPNGHIIRWKETTPEALTFNWDIFLFGARATASATNVNLSGLTADNDFSSPDGLWFSQATNICWIQTDDGAYTDVTNCMLLAALPGQVGDGGPRTITNTDAGGNSKQVQTYVGATLPAATKLKRFLVGPVDCEITGVAETPDGKALFVNIQHPGEGTTAANINTPLSTWPSSTAGARPRSATIVITKNDGGVIGV